MQKKKYSVWDKWRKKMCVKIVALENIDVIAYLFEDHLKLIKQPTFIKK